MHGDEIQYSIFWCFDVSLFAGRNEKVQKKLQFEYWKFIYFGFGNSSARICCSCRCFCHYRDACLTHASWTEKNRLCSRHLDYHFNKLLLMLIIFNVMRRFSVYPQMVGDIPWLWRKQWAKEVHVKCRAIVWITANLGSGFLVSIVHIKKSMSCSPLLNIN